MLVSPDPGLYSFINQGALTVDGIDDVEEMKITDVCIVSMEKDPKKKISLKIVILMKVFLFKICYVYFYI